MNFWAKIKILNEWIKKSENIVIFTGSFSGLSRFQNSKYWKKKHFDFNQKLSYDYFLHHPESFYQILKKEIGNCTVRLSKTHLWIAGLEKNVTVITERIDFLHQLAGNKKVLELRGNWNTYSCMKCGKQYNQSILKKELPICECNGLIRPNMVLFGESLNEDIWNESVFAVLKAEMIIVIGSLNDTASEFFSYYQGNRFVIINNQKMPYDTNADLIFHDPIMKVIRKLKK